MPDLYDYIVDITSKYKDLKYRSTLAEQCQKDDFKKRDIIQSYFYDMLRKRIERGSYYTNDDEMFLFVDSLAFYNKTMSEFFEGNCSTNNFLRFMADFLSNRSEELIGLIRNHAVLYKITRTESETSRFDLENKRTESSYLNAVDDSKEYELQLEQNLAFDISENNKTLQRLKNGIYDSSIEFIENVICTMECQSIDSVEVSFCYIYDFITNALHYYVMYFSSKTNKKYKENQTILDCLRTANFENYFEGEIEGKIVEILKDVIYHLSIRRHTDFNIENFSNNVFVRYD